MIKMQNVRKTYPGFDFELSLEIPEGRITGLIGKNGAGKSTAIRLMLGLVKAESGTIELFGKPITEITMQDRQKIGVSLASRASTDVYDRGGEKDPGENVSGIR